MEKAAKKSKCKTLQKIKCFDNALSCSPSLSSTVRDLETESDASRTTARSSPSVAAAAEVLSTRERPEVVEGINGVVSAITSPIDTGNFTRAGMVLLESGFVRLGGQSFPCKLQQLPLRRKGHAFLEPKV
jgi:hypothetical protein